MAVKVCHWRKRNGRRRTIRLFKAWRNLLSRIRGHHVDGSGVARWYGLENGFRDWEHFRAWAVAAGYNRKGLSLDRKDEAKGYTPDNCQWITRKENADKANTAHRSGCTCWCCKKRRTDAFLCEHGKLDCDICEGEM